MTDEKLLEFIWRDLHAELFRFIQFKVKDDSLAEDLLQDVFVKIHLNLHQLQDSKKMTSWVYQITRNTINDHYRKSKNIPSDTLLFEEEEGKESLYDALSSCINGKIENLPTNDKQAVLLTYFQNYNQKQLAEFLDISYSGAKNRVQRVRKKIEKAILECDNVEVSSTGEIKRFII